MAKLSAHFDSSEFRCKCCNQLPESGINPDLIELLEEIRRALAKPLIITSGYRCEPHNRECGGKPKSQHMLGNAADIHISGVSASQLWTFLDRNFQSRCKGLGKYPSFVHVDVREGTPARWVG